jgi:XTP/dITP diphosphohydrolase
MTVVFATNNKSKIKELTPMLQSAGFELTTLADLELTCSPDETSDTFEENALIKADETAKLLTEAGHTNVIVLADDSGIEIDALGKKPGVDSANFLGTDTPYEIRNAKILDMLADVPDAERTARFVCVIAAVLPTGERKTTRATVEGVIAREQRGENGFGYDPIFFLPERGKTTAELSQEEKNEISHRGKALQKMIEALS